MRQSNVELLRVVSILLVLVLHADFSALDVPSYSSDDRLLILDFLRIEYESIALVSVNVFIIISGYFSISINFKHLFSLGFMVLFWNIVLTGISIGLGWVLPSQAIGFLIPGLNDWFVQCYILLVLLSPLCNLFANHTEVNSLLKYIISFFIIEFVFGWLIFWGNAFYGGYSILHFIGLYLIGRYIRLSDFTLHGRPARLISYYFILMTIPAIFLFTTLNLVEDVKFCSYLTQRFTAYTSPFNVLGAVLLFVAFKKVNLQSKLINNLAGAVFSVYLIHTFPPVFLWYKKLSLELFMWNSVIWASCLFLVVCMVFFLGFLLDRVRVFLFSSLTRYIKIERLNAQPFSKLMIKI